MTDTRYSPTPDEFFKAAVHAAGLLSFRNAFGLTDSAEVTAIKSEFSREDFEEAGCERNLDAWIRDYAGIAGPLTAGQRREGFIELLIHETPKAESLDVLLGGVMKGLYDEFSQCRQTHPFWLNPAQARRWHALSLARRLPMLLVYAHGLLAKIHEANAEVFSKLTPPMIWRTLTAKEPVDAAFEGRRIQNLWFDAVVQPQVVEKTKSGVAAAAKLDVASFRKMISGASEPEWHTLGKCVDGVANGNPDAKAALIHAYLFARILDSVWASLGELFGENDAERLREILSGAGIRVDETCGYVDEERHRFFAGGISECATTMLSLPRLAVLAVKSGSLSRAVRLAESSMCV